jgi:hypothetical protein
MDVNQPAPSQPGWGGAMKEHMSLISVTKKIAESYDGAIFPKI